tara:strand:+ start:522 stop:1103 length:582 start_codon:yes stop_codon:yes gene_type:complete
MQPDTYARVKTLAGHNRLALSSMAQELIEAALALPKYVDQVQAAAVQVAPKKDTRTYRPQRQTRDDYATQPPAEYEIPKDFDPLNKGGVKLFQKEGAKERAKLFQNERGAQYNTEEGRALIEEQKNAPKGKRVNFTAIVDGVAKANEQDNTELDDVIPVEIEEKPKPQLTQEQINEAMRVLQMASEQLAEKAE